MRVLAGGEKMPMERWSPFRELLNVENELDRTVRRVLGWPGRRPAMAWTPAVESYARGNDLVVKLEVPGIDPDQVEISIKDNILRIQGERRQRETVRDEDYYAEEFSYGSFERTLTLPREAKADDIKATYENGVLEILVPQAAEAAAQVRKIPVQVKKQP
jgi:HSP20 family protein